MCRTRGFTRRQVTTTRVWQATIIVLTALVIGVPIGAALGATLWRTFAGQLDVVAVVVLPIATVAVVTLVALVAANAAVLVPGRAAAKVSPAAGLRRL